MPLWLYTALALVSVAAGCAMAAMRLGWRADRLRDEDVNRRIDMRVEAMDLKRRHRDPGVDSQS